MFYVSPRRTLRIPMSRSRLSQLPLLVLLLLLRRLLLPLGALQAPQAALAPLRAVPQRRAVRLRLHRHQRVRRVLPRLVLLLVLALRRLVRLVLAPRLVLLPLQLSWLLRMLSTRIALLPPLLSALLLPLRRQRLVLLRRTCLLLQKTPPKRPLVPLSLPLVMLPTRQTPLRRALLKRLMWSHREFRALPTSSRVACYCLVSFPANLVVLMTTHL